MTMKNVDHDEISAVLLTDVCMYVWMDGWMDGWMDAVAVAGVGEK